MDHIAAYEKLVGGALFKEWKQMNSAYLAHFFCEFDEKLETGLWQIGFYDRKNDLITTFVVANTITQMPSEEVFKKEGVVEELELEKVNISAAQALEKAAALQKKKYPQHPIMKGIVILQHLDRIVWNVTFITASFAALNVKIDAGKGDIVKDDLSTFFDMSETSRF